MVHFEQGVQNEQVASIGNLAISRVRGGTVFALSSSVHFNFGDYRMLDELIVVLRLAVALVGERLGLRAKLNFRRAKVILVVGDNLEESYYDKF
jgi:hypothetical protein